LISALHPLDLFDVPAFAEERFERTVKPENRILTLAAHGLNPIAVLYSTLLGGASKKRSPTPTNGFRETFLFFLSWRPFDFSSYAMRLSRNQSRIRIRNPKHQIYAQVILVNS
jgi:hypothetical protein